MHKPGIPIRSGPDKRLASADYTLLGLSSLPRQRRTFAVYGGEGRPGFAPRVSSARMRWTAIAFSAALALLTTTPTSAQQSPFSTLITTPLAIEGLTTDGSNLYTIGRGADGPC